MTGFGLVIGQAWKIGGLEKQAALLARELHKRGIGVMLFISGPIRGFRISGALDLDPIPWKHLYHISHFPLISHRLLRYYCRRYGISHLVAFNTENAEIAVASKIEAKIAMNVRGMRFLTNPSLAERCKKAASSCECTITNSENTANLLQKSGIVSDEKIKVINNGIALPDTEPPQNEKVVLYVGSIKQVKDPMTFIEACRKVIAADNDVRVIMAGNGDMRPLVESYIADNGLEAHFTLLGEVPFSKIPYGKASVYVNSSLSESSSNSLLEALSYGIPSVATANSGNSCILSGLEHHKLVPISNSDEMAEAIKLLLDTDAETRKKIFEESRRLIQKRYSISRMVDEYIETLLSL